MNSCRLEGWIQLNFFGGHRLDLDDLIGAAFLDQADNDPARLGCVPGPVHDATGSRAVGLELLKIEIEILHGVLTNLLAGLAQGLPVRHLVDDAGTLGLNDIGRVTHVSA